MLKPNCRAIRDARRKKAWTQIRLAEKAGIAARVVQDTENEKVVADGRRFTLTTMTSIAGALEVLSSDIVIPEHDPVEVAGWLVRALDREKEICQEKNQKFFTAHELLALVKITGGGAQRCFAYLDIQPIAVELSSRLESIFPESDETRFADFDWGERPCYRLGFELARKDGRMTDKHYLIAILTEKRPNGKGSRTVDWLRRRIGEETFERLVEEAKSDPGGADPQHDADSFTI